MKVNRKTLLLASSFLALFALACSYGVGVGRYRLSPYAQVRALGNSFRTIAGETETKLYGRWGRARASRGLASDDEETLNRLSALGYLRGYTPAENAGGVTVLEAGSVEDGLTLFTSGHAPVAHLVSLAGELVHRWEITFEELWPGDLPMEISDQHNEKEFIRRAHVFPNGDLLGVFEYIGIFKLDRDSNVLWKRLESSPFLVETLRGS